MTPLRFVAMLALAFACAGNVRQMFFPESTRNQMMVDIWAPEGIRIQDVSEYAREVEAHLLEDERVASVASFIGAGLVHLLARKYVRIAFTGLMILACYRMLTA